MTIWNGRKWIHSWWKVVVLGIHFSGINISLCFTCTLDNCSVFQTYFPEAVTRFSEKNYLKQHQMRVEHTILSLSCSLWFVTKQMSHNTLNQSYHSWKIAVMCWWVPGFRNIMCNIIQCCVCCSMVHCWRMLHLQLCHHTLVNMQKVPSVIAEIDIIVKMELIPITALHL